MESKVEIKSECSDELPEAMKNNMTIGALHNEYQRKGGEDLVFSNEVNLLRSLGHSIKELVVTNKTISGIVGKLRVAFNVSDSVSSREKVAQFLARSDVDLVHIHNLFPILTPSVYDACVEAEIPVVQTLHNYRTICPGSLLMRDGKVCEKCVTGSPYQSVLHGCYRDSQIGTLAVARMVNYHRKSNTWNTKVNRFIALTEFAKAKFVEAGFDPKKIAVKPNFIPDPISPGTDLNKRNRTALFVGRISQEKGIRTLTRAWKQMSLELVIAGDGPLLDSLSSTNRSGSIRLLGPQSNAQISDLMLNARFLVMPSEWYEGFPMVLAEAFAHGLPVLASRLGGMREIIENGATGLHFEAGNAHDLSEKAQWLLDHSNECRRMGENARNKYLAKYTPRKNYDMLMRIYEEAANDQQQNALP